MSRSATLLAAYLMKERKMGYQEALAYLRSKRPCVHPNDGFMHQLLLYERMAFKLDPNFKPYKLYRLVCIHNNVKQTKILPPKNLLFQTENNLKQLETKSEPPIETVYRCKKCRTILGSSRNVLPHSAKQHPTWFSLLDWDSRRSVECRQGVFMEPIASTMSKVCQTASESRLHCLKCDNKLGTFSWEGPVSCGCGGSMVPGFLLNLSRIDKCTMRKDVEAVI